MVGVEAGGTGREGQKMGRLNAPRQIPYEFHVFEWDGMVWLFDQSERQFPCTAVPHIYAEPLYWVDSECDEPLRDGGLFLDDYQAPDVPDQEAWDAAREEAHANHRI